MQSRELRFRCWNKIKKQWEPIGWTNNYKYRKGSRYVGKILTLVGGINEEDGAIMQYTGLKDKNGVEIYEGDIVHDHGDLAPNQIAAVEWFDGSYGGGWEPWASAVNIPYAGRIAFADLKDCEVIGNVYENPELLK